MQVLKTRPTEVRELKKLKLPLTSQLQEQFSHDDKKNNKHGQNLYVSLVHGRAIVDLDYFGTPREFSMTTTQMIIVTELAKQHGDCAIECFPTSYLTQIAGLVKAGILDKYAATHDYNNHSLNISFSFMPPAENVYEIFAESLQKTKVLFPQYFLADGHLYPKNV